MNCLYRVNLLPRLRNHQKYVVTAQQIIFKSYKTERGMFPPRRPPPRIDYNGPPPRLHFTPNVNANANANTNAKTNANTNAKTNANRPRFDYIRPSFGFYPPQAPQMDWDSEYSHQNHRPHMKVHCGQLREHHEGMEVEISGKVHKQRLGRFLTLKDANGMTQCIVPDDKPYLIRKVTNIPIDSYMVIYGAVSKRPKNQRNTIMNTGSVEVLINKIQTVHPFRNGKDTTKNISMMQTRQTSSCANSLGVTSEEFKRCASPSISKKFSNRTHNCGELITAHKGTTVTLCGWIESKQGRFVQLRDGYGLVQTVVPAGNDDVYTAISNIIPETLVEISGVVCLRPESQINNTMSTGHVEVQIQSIKHIIADESSKTDETPVESVDTASINASINVNSFTTRSFNCGQLRDEHIGQIVTLCGWLEFHRVGKFVILRDGYGRTQLIIPEENKELQQEVDKLPLESILQVCGVVTSRPPGSEQPAMSTGRVEVVLQRLKVLNRAQEKLPFNLRDFNKAKEALRMQYRYLDLRYAEMQRNLRMRSRFLMDIREFLVNQAGFVDVETPTLFRATPGGAQEFVVPTRFPNQFYSLVQSPQQFKQMLMAGAIDRYFQIARCYRDEGARSDRQPEFTQLDIEMSFTNVEGVIELVEQLLKHCWPEYMTPLSVPFRRISYRDAMELYGSDKPDILIPNTLIDCSDILKPKQNGCEFDSRALVFRKPLVDLSNSIKNKYNDQFTLAHPNVKLIQYKFNGTTSDWIQSISKLLGDSIPKQLVEYLNLNDECVLFLAYGNKSDVCSLLGKIRTDFVNHLEERGHQVRSSNMHFMWVVDFPLFEKRQNGMLATVHHPFTAPHPDDLLLINSDPLKVRSLAYDLVLNGNEIAGGSIRIHDVEQQKCILSKLNISQNEMQHLLDALASGCPPHGGVALGLDRLLAVMLKTKSIRDVIAFPKGLEGRDPLSGAPVAISEDDKKLYHIRERSVVSGANDTIYYDTNTSLKEAN